jgi:hypothetical protein
VGREAAMKRPPNDNFELVMEAGDQQQEPEWSDCGSRRKRCLWAPDYCDHHTALGDDEYHARVDAKLTWEDKT